MLRPPPNQQGYYSQYAQQPASGSSSSGISASVNRLTSEVDSMFKGWFLGYLYLSHNRATDSPLRIDSWDRLTEQIHALAHTLVVSRRYLDFCFGPHLLLLYVVSGLSPASLDVFVFSSSRLKYRSCVHVVAFQYLYPFCPATSGHDI